MPALINLWRCPGDKSGDIAIFKPVTHGNVGEYPPCTKIVLA